MTFVIGLSLGLLIGVLGTAAWMRDTARKSRRLLKDAEGRYERAIESLKRSLACHDAAEKKLQETISLKVEAEALFARREFDHLVDGKGGAA